MYASYAHATESSTTLTGALWAAPAALRYTWHSLLDGTLSARVTAISSTLSPRAVLAAEVADAVGARLQQVQQVLPCGACSRCNRCRHFRLACLPWDRHGTVLKFRGSPASDLQLRISKRARACRTARQPLLARPRCCAATLCSCTRPWHGRLTGGKAERRGGASPSTCIVAVAVVVSKAESLRYAARVMALNALGLVEASSARVAHVDRSKVTGTRLLGTTDESDDSSKATPSLLGNSDESNDDAVGSA